MASNTSLVPLGFKLTDVGVIPNDWSFCHLEDIRDKSRKWSFTGGPFGSSLKSEDYTNTGVRIIQLQNIGDGIFCDDSKVYTSAKKADELLSNNIYPGDILLSKMGDPVARACIVPNQENRYVMCSDGIRIAINEKEFNSYFIKEYINSKSFRLRAIDSSTGSTRMRIGIGDLKKLFVIKMPKLEQERIVEVLSDTDSLIFKLDQLIQKKLNIKQGVMQELLTGKNRLPGFSCEWNAYKLGSVVKILRGGSPRPIENYLTTNDGINWIKIGDVNIGAKYITHTEEKIKFAGRRYSREVSVGDLLLSNSMSYGRPYILKIEGCIHDGWLVLQNYESHFDLEYLYYLLSSVQTVNQYRQKAAGSGVLNLNKQLVSTVELLIPPKDEQTAIAQVLSDMDTEIESLEKQKAKYFDLKQSMMQQLLTGKIRLI
jgi:type I restriction enzyme S subunit